MIEKLGYMIKQFYDAYNTGEGITLFISPDLKVTISKLKDGGTYPNAVFIDEYIPNEVFEKLNKMETEHRVNTFKVYEKIDELKKRGEE